MAKLIAGFTTLMVLGFVAGFILAGCTPREPPGKNLWRIPQLQGR